MFWAITLAISIVVALSLLASLRHKARRDATRRDYDVNVYKDQLQELEREAAEGRIAESELAAARTEIQRRLLAADAAGSDADKPASAGRAPLIAAAIAAPAAAIVLYATLGTPGMPDFPLAERAGLSAEATDADKAMVSLTQALEGRLQQQPDDPRGWILLGRSYATLGNADKAIAAFERALPLTNRAPDVLADWAELKLMNGDSQFTEEIFMAFVEARQKDPSLPKPWFYIGLDRAQGGKYQEAAQIWTDLLFIAPPDADYVPAVREKVQQAAADGGFDAASLEPTDVAKMVAREIARNSQPPETQAPGPSREDVEAAGEMSAEDRAAFIRSMVDRLAARLEENPNDPAGWQRLIRAYEVLGETEKAAEARARLEAVQGQ